MHEHLFVSNAAYAIHSTVEDFYAAVEQRDHPDLFCRPLLVVGRGRSRVLGASREARLTGVRSGMTTDDARRLCPEAVRVSPRFGAYLRAHDEVLSVLAAGAGDLDDVGPGEAYCQPRQHQGRPVGRLANALRAEIFDRVGLHMSFGVARTRYLAKVASTNADPSGVTVVDPDREREFLQPLAIGSLWDIGPATAARLAERGINTLRDVVAAGEQATVAAVGGPTGRHLHAVALGHDHRPVPRLVRHSISVQVAIDEHDPSALPADLLAGLAETLASRLVAEAKGTRTVSLRLRFGDLTTTVRTRTMRHLTQRADELLPSALHLLRTADPAVRSRGLLVMTLIAENTSEQVADQPTLPLGDA